MKNKNIIIIGLLIAVALLSTFTIYTWYQGLPGTETLLVSFETGGDDVPSQNGTRQQAQTFIAGGDWKLTKISLYARLDGSDDTPGVITINIKSAGSGSTGPVGSSLAISTYDGNSLTVSDAWIDFGLSSEVQLVSGLEYAIQISVASDGANFIITSTDSYAAGDYFESVDSGTNWFTSTEDMYFRVYGYAT